MTGCRWCHQHKVKARALVGREGAIVHLYICLRAEYSWLEVNSKLHPLWQDQTGSAALHRRTLATAEKKRSSWLSKHAGPCPEVFQQLARPPWLISFISLACHVTYHSWNTSFSSQHVWVTDRLQRFVPATMFKIQSNQNLEHYQFANTRCKNMNRVTSIRVNSPWTSRRRRVTGYKTNAVGLFFCCCCFF